MALATRRSYAGAAPACTLSSDIAAGATSFSITGTTTNWPTTATGPFYMVIDPGLSTEEKVLVGARTSGSLSSVTRGVDGTTAASHVTGATCYPVFTAVDANDANLLASRLSAKGDLISSDGTDPTKVAVGANNTRLVADSAQTSGIKWVADTQNTVVDAKGDLLVGSANDTVARLAVGSDGHVLVADSTATNGLSYSPLNGWRNAIINGDFSVNQRGFTSTTTNATYGFDRWRLGATDGTVTYSTQAFTLGNQISGQEPTNFARIVATGQTSSSAEASLIQPIESVRTFAGETVTISFWAKANTGTPKVAIEWQQRFGSGGSPSSIVFTYGGQVTLSTSWARYSVTFAVPSISGKTIGTDVNSSSCWMHLFVSAGTGLNSRTGSLGIQSNTFDFWGVQVEAGSDMTTFERRPQQVELALCQRYCVKFGGESTYYYDNAGLGIGASSTVAGIQVVYPVEMRAVPGTPSFSGCRLSDTVTPYTITGISLNTFISNRKRAWLDCTVASGLTTYRPYSLEVGGGASTNNLILSAEL